ncbi:MULTISPECIES: EF-hand domain-containing protein [unclassified Novosphingobium]|uniref:EF-hand domain-containing protein n=1 Tax=unclassified Novosphingobium TaxID=2644732 RepID=UPI00190F1045|nr:MULTISPECIES: EF-hand domain-containing protein [unclassified Novosphingobium]
MITTIKKLTLGLSVAALSIGGVACAQAPAAPDRPGHERPKIDANGDGVVTRAEAQAAAAAMFAKLDVNKDGKIDQADRELARQQKREGKFAKLDTNKDGSISKAEFMADRGPEGRGRGPGMDGPPPPPGEMGKDGPGKDGPRGEGRGHHGKRGGHGFGGGRMGGGMMAMARDADTNHDGAISKDEFMAAAMKRFDAADTNHDGKVTKEEKQAAREAMKAQWEAKRADKKAGN